MDLDCPVPSKLSRGAHHHLRCAMHDALFVAPLWMHVCRILPLLTMIHPMAGIYSVRTGFATYPYLPLRALCRHRGKNVNVATAKHDGSPTARPTNTMHLGLFRVNNEPLGRPSLAHFMGYIALGRTPLYLSSSSFNSCLLGKHVR